MKHWLDRPAWSALTTIHANLAEGGDRARRYPPSIVPFAATVDDTPESLRELESLPEPDESMLFLQADPVALPPGLIAVSDAAGVQMVAEGPVERVTDDRIRPLAKPDAEEMLALATLTKPGPFSLRALSLGNFWGIRMDGRLVAMAGERMRQTGFSELSGVCSHPDFRGRGFGRLLSRFVAGEIAARGDVPYLHAYAANTPAISLYASLGFKLRTEMNVTIVKRRP